MASDDPATVRTCLAELRAVLGLGAPDPAVCDDPAALAPPPVFQPAGETTPQCSPVPGAPAARIPPVLFSLQFPGGAPPVLEPLEPLDRLLCRFLRARDFKIDKVCGAGGWNRYALPGHLPGHSPREACANWKPIRFASA